MPSASASAGAILPDGIGRFFVRLIIASISLSYHWLIAPEAPAPAAMANRDISASAGCITASARYMAAKLVKITRLITRGFNSAKKSPAEPLLTSSADAIVAVSSNGVFCIDTDIAVIFPVRVIPPCYFTFGSASKVWNGGGEDTCHSRVVAPSPHGLSAALRFEIKASTISARNTSVAAAEIYEPIEAT